MLTLNQFTIKNEATLLSQIISLTPSLKIFRQLQGQWHL